MAFYANMYVRVKTIKAKAVLLVFNEYSDYEDESWIPLSTINNPEVLDQLDKDEGCVVEVAKWVLKNNGIQYDGLEYGDNEEVKSLDKIIK